MILRFALRNLSYSAKNLRSLSKVKKAMREVDAERPFCAYCGRAGDTDIHHKVPVSHCIELGRPELAWDKDNMIPLCRGKKCHFVIGHFSDWKQFNVNVESVCRLASSYESKT